MQISPKKECKRTFRSFFNIYLYIYVYIYLPKNEIFLRSFPFFVKECCVLCVLFPSLEKNGKERNILLGRISRQKLEKRTEKKGTFLLKNGKERNVSNGKERSAQPWCFVIFLLYIYFLLLRYRCLCMTKRHFVLCTIALLGKKGLTSKPSVRVFKKRI